MAGALEGVRIVELSQMITGPLAAMMLADLGADVVKVEQPGKGDLFRSYRGHLYSPYFCSYNRNKRCITLNLRSQQGRDIVLRLVHDADVVIANFRPGVMERLELGLEALRAENPRLIYCSITGFGEDGPYKLRPAYDAVAQSLSGLSSLFLDPERPQITGPTVSDNLTGIYAAYGILGALMERDRTGVARRVDVNMLEATLAFFPDPYSALSRGGDEPGPLWRVSASQSHALTGADGKMVAIHMSSPEKFWQGALAALEREELAEDPRFATHAARIDNYLALTAELKEAARRHPREELMRRFEEHDVPYAPINRLSETLEDAQVRHLGSFADLAHPTEGALKAIRRPVWYDGSREDQPMTPPPVLGEHTEEVLAELGYDSEAVAALRRDEVI